jgi:hypothetical protein
MFGSKDREIRRLKALAGARHSKIEFQREHVRIIYGQRSKAWKNYGSAMDIIATHLTLGGSHTQLRAALIAAGHGLELEYALLDHPVNDKPAGAEATS